MKRLQRFFSQITVVLLAIALCVGCKKSTYEFSDTTEDPQVESYTVTFESNGGSSVDAQTVEYSSTATSITPTKTDYTFDGWYSDSGLTTAYDFSTEVTADITLYAKWTATSGELNDLDYDPMW